MLFVEQIQQVITITKEAGHFAAGKKHVCKCLQFSSVTAGTEGKALQKIPANAR